jgi:hypothetical protein
MIRIALTFAGLAIAVGMALAPSQEECCGGDPTKQCPPICAPGQVPAR